MPMKFNIFPDKNYFEAIQIGVVQIDDLIQAYLDFFDNGGWQPGMKEFTDLSKADLSNLNTNEILKLSKAINSIYEKHQLTDVKNAIYSPNATLFGVSGMYEVFGSMASENVRVFSDKSIAMKWLLD